MTVAADADAVAGRRRSRAPLPGAKLCLLPGEAHLPWAGDSGAVLDALEDFVEPHVPA